MPVMTHNHTGVPRHNWLVRYYRAQLRFNLHVLTAVRILPPPLAAAGFAWLRRTEVPKRGRTMSHPIRSKIVIPAALLLGTALVLFLAGCGQRSSAEKPGTPLGGNVSPGSARLDEWTRPATGDPEQFAIAFARAIWTYDTSRHTYFDWQDAVSQYSDPDGASAFVARSLLPSLTEWNAMTPHQARATVAAIFAQTTPELEKTKAQREIPAGWQAFIIRGKQTVKLDTGTKVLDRQATISMVCRTTCKFWSGSAQVAA